MQEATQECPIPAFIPALIPAPKPRPKYTQSTLACLLYLTEKNDWKRGKSLDWLTAICWKAVNAKPALFLISPWSNYRMTVSQSEKHPNRTTYCDNNTSTMTREWIQEWILEYLSPYIGRALNDLETATYAAQRGRFPLVNKFRFIGRACRFALIKEIQARSDSHKDAEGRWVNCRTTLNRCYGDEEGTPTELVNLVQSSDNTSVLDWVDANREDFELLGEGIYEGVRGFTESYLYGSGKGDTTRALASEYQVSEAHARKLKVKFCQRIQSVAKNPLIQEFYARLNNPSPYKPCEMAVEQSSDSKFRAAIAVQVAQDMAEFASWLGNKQIADEIHKEETRQACFERATLAEESALLSANATHSTLIDDWESKRQRVIAETVLKDVDLELDSDSLGELLAEAGRPEYGDDMEYTLLGDPVAADAGLSDTLAELQEEDSE